MAPNGHDPGRYDAQEIPWEQIFRIAPIAVLVLLVIYLGWRSFYTVEASERAVVLRFGKHHATTGPGLHFMIPLVDEAMIVSVKENVVDLPTSREARSASSRADSQRVRMLANENLMLTGDLNAAVVEWTLQWQVFEPDKYLFSIANEDIEETIKAVAQSVMHRLVGDYSIDEMLTAKREEVTLAAEDATQKVLDQYDCGIQVTGLQMQRVTPPDRVKPSFDQVNASLQDRVKLVNEANRERNRLIPKAKAKRDQLIQEAKGYADRRRAEAQGEIAALMAKFQAYREAPEATRHRLYLEAMEEILAGSGPKTLLDADLKSLLPLLQLGAESD